MNPLIGEVDLYAVDIIYFFVLVEFLHLCQNCIHIGIGSKIYAVLGNKIWRISRTELACLHTLLGQIGKDKGYANQSITSVMSSGIDYSAIAFAADNSTRFLHLGNNIHLTHGSSVVLTAILAGNIAQSTGTAEVADGIAGGMLQNVIGNGYQGVFLAVHSAVLAEKCQTVNIGIDDKAYIMTALLHQCLYVCKIFLEWFGIVLEVAGRFGKETGNCLNAQLLEQLGQNNAAYAVHAVESHTEVGLLDGFCIHKVEAKYHIYMLLIVAVIFAIAAQMVHIGIFEIFCLGNTQHFVTLCLIQEFALLVQQLQRIPHTGVMAGCDDDTATGTFHRNGNLCCGSGGQTDVHDIEAHTHKGSANHVLYHRS